MSFLTVIIFCATIFCVQSVTYNINSSTTNWQTILSNLKAGDIVTIHHGTYVTPGFFQLTLNGTLNNPIIIQGAPNETRPIIQGPVAGANAQNVINIQGSNFMVKGIAFTKGSRGVRLGPAVTSNAIFDNIYIFNTTGTAFSANDNANEYANITLQNSEITNTNALAATTGECVYVGCVSDECRIRDSLFQHNYCHDTLGSVGGSRAGFQIKPGSYNVIIRNNVCYNVVGPCIIVYDGYDRGRNLIDGNLAVNAGTADIGIQCTSGATITNNIVINSNLAGIGVIVNSLYPNVSYTRNITINQNTVYMSQADACLRLNSVTNKNITILNNVFYCGNQPSIKASNDLTGARIYNNAINGSISATGISSCGTFAISSNAFLNAAATNFYPASSSLLINKGVNLRYQAFYDYNGMPRSIVTPTVGAYEYSTTNNHGCPVINNFKCASSTASVPQYPLTP
ncbi:unnamed protein product [Rotaria socialis]|uniref:Right handed beta helix domain-containing protein n=1 Tax=Rotaria socialis TaxID=392032 RepID=A0A821A659_9BILA|nr:unnamed protein product [Rotaria socialis]CAF4575667.1 unnamed protein product [Rotaria socialis]